MEQERLFEAALELAGTGWRVTGSSFSGEPKVLEIGLEQERDRKVVCPECGQSCGAYDTVEKRWRHLNFFQYHCELVAKVPRSECEKCGVKMVEVPWARSGSGFTLLFEAAVMLLAKQMPVSAIAEAVGEQDTRLWRLIRELVQAAHARRDWSHVRSIALDETSIRKGKRYMTVFLDADTRTVLLVVEGRSGDCVRQFAEALQEHQGDPAQIQWVTMDMLHCYARGVADYLPQAKIVYDRYHVMVMAGEAVEEVRRSLQRQGAPLKGSLWALRGNEWNLTADQQTIRQTLAQTYKPIGKALALRDALQDIYQAGAAQGPELLEQWCQWASRSRLAPFLKLAETIRSYWKGITAFFTSYLTQGAIEAINGIIQLARRRARGFRNFDYLRTITYCVKGGLDFKLPSLLPT